MTSRAAAIIPAAGSGSRMKSDIPKQFLTLAGRPIIAHTVDAFRASPFISQIIVVVSEDRIEQTTEILAGEGAEEPEVLVVAGGSRRQDSVLAGLEATAEGTDIVLVHDGARPFVSPELIENCYRQSLETGAAIAAVRVKDTLKKESTDSCIAETIDRSSLWQAQTPQAARKELLIQAFEEGEGADVTDEASLLEQAGIPVRLVPGETTNIKITTPEDLEYAKNTMKKREISLRIGHGFDAHRFAENRKLVLGGVEIEYHLGLAGHSDADVLTHALCDAILGALGFGDIGTHFPDNDDRYRNIRSLNLLEDVIEMAAGRQTALANADITVVCQSPKLAPHMAEMRRNLAGCCRVDIDRINIKATTTEKMGYTGRQEGISCHAVILLESTVDN